MPKRLTPLRSIRAFCLWCCLGNYREIGLCPAEECSLHPFRSGKGSRGKGSILKPVRAKCLDCSGYSIVSARDCWAEECSLWPYRMGKRPKKEGAPKRKGSNKGIEAMRKARLSAKVPS